MGMRRTIREFRKHWRFIGGMILLALLAGVGTAGTVGSTIVFVGSAVAATAAASQEEGIPATSH